MLIGLKGYKGAGKDTVASILVKQHGFEQLAFAAKLKEAMAVLFDVAIEDIDRWKNEQKQIAVIDGQFPLVTVGQPFTWRQLLQRAGDMGRNIFGEDFWVDQVLPDTTPFIILNDVVISDVRMENEARRVKLDGGYVVEVIRPGCDPDEHESEHPLPDHLLDATIVNSGTIEDLAEETAEVLDFLRKKQGFHV